MDEKSGLLYIESVQSFSSADFEEVEAHESAVHKMINKTHINDILESNISAEV